MHIILADVMWMRQFVNLTCLEVVDLTQSYKFVIESDDEFVIEATLLTQSYINL